MSKLPEPTIDTVKSRVETNLLNDGFLHPYAILCTFKDKNVGVGISTPHNTDTKTINVSRLLVALDQIETYKVLLIHEAWKYIKPDNMDETEFAETMKDKAMCEFLDKREGYMITEVTRDSVKTGVREYHKTEYDTIGFVGDLLITNDNEKASPYGYEQIQDKLVTRN